MRPTKPELNKIRRSLPYGGMQAIADRLKEKRINISYQMVSKALRGHVEGQETVDIVVKEAYAFLKEWNRETSKYDSNLKKIAKELK